MVWKFFGNEKFSQSFGRNAKIRWSFGILRSASRGFPFFSWWNEILLCTRAFPKATLKFGKVLSANETIGVNINFSKLFWQLFQKSCRPHILVGMFKVNNRNTRTRCKICSKLTIKTPERRHFPSASIVNFEHVPVGWVLIYVLSKAFFWMLEIWRNIEIWDNMC